MASKAAVGVGLGLAAVGIIVLASRAKGAPPEEEEGVLKIEILDSEGNPVPSNSPALLAEGEDYTLRVTITNQSTKGGEPWPAALSFSVYAGTNLQTFIPVTSYTASFGAGESIAYTWPLNIPMGTGGQSGNVLVTVWDPDGIQIASGIVYFDIQTVEIIYDADIVVGV